MVLVFLPFHFAGGGPKPTTSATMELAMEVVAREALEGIRGRTTEVDPLGHATAEMSQVNIVLISMTLNQTREAPSI